MSYTTPESIKARGLEILKVLCIDKNFEKMPEIMIPDVEAYHDDRPALVGRDNFISHWRMLLTKLTEISYEIYDSVAEVGKSGNGGKVWIFSRLSGLPGGMAKDTVDMFEINGAGNLVRMKDVQRTIEH